MFWRCFQTERHSQGAASLNAPVGGTLTTTRARFIPFPSSLFTSSAFLSDLHSVSTFLSLPSCGRAD
jgi:hypothetical protein